MRKRIIGQEPPASPTHHGAWLDLTTVAAVEVSSEAPSSPIEGVFTGTGNWTAASPGAATITLRFDAPTRVTRSAIEVIDPDHERTQEWALRAFFSDGTDRELLRQGWNFSPGGATRQLEEYNFNLDEVVALSLTIDPDKGRDRYPATLTNWKVG